jgi:type II secretion system protein N
MTRILKLLGAALASVLLIVLAILIAGAWYMRQPRVIENIRLHAAQSIGGDVLFSDLDLKLFKGFSVENLRIYPDPVALPGQEFLEIRSIDLRYIPWKFFRRTIEFKNVILKQPHLILRQTRDGTWKLPRTNLDQLTKPLTFETGLLRFIILMDDFDLRDGSVTALSDSGKTLFQASGVQLQGNLALDPGTANASGALRIHRMVLARSLQIDSLNTPLNLTHRTLSLPELGADIHGGRLGGNLQTDLAAQEPSFQGTLNLTSVQLSSLLREFKAREGLLEGQLDVKAQLTGTLREPHLAQGTGEFEIRNAKLSGLGLSGTVAELLRIPELATQNFAKVRGTFKIAEEKLTFYNLEAISPRMQATATGQIGLGRNLDFDVQLALNPELTAALPSEMRKRLNMRPDGYGTFTFKVEGTLDAPRSNLAEKFTTKP